jgi:ABC-type molybdenum transport system ATPase subunit/photorepair protein PhrA
MNRVTEQELVDRLDAARALATKIKNLQDAKNKLTKIIASGYAVDITITTTVSHPVKLQASTSSLTPFEPTELKAVLALSLSTVERKLAELKRVYEEL